VLQQAVIFHAELREFFARLDAGGQSSALRVAYDV
jgi:hypothetical protein